MKKIYLILIIASVYAFNVKGEYLTSELTSDCPKELENFKKENSDYELKFSKLKTGSDSLHIFFGSMIKNNKTDYWISSAFKGQQFTREISLKSKDSLNFLTDDLTFEFNPFDPISPLSVSLRILYKPSTNKVEYLWLNNGISSHTASIKKVEKPIQEGKKFPEITMNSISEKTISTKDFKDKIVIINWWSTGCAPCVKEIPELNKIAEKYKSNNNVLFLAITNDNRERVTKFLEKHEFRYNQVLGNESTNKIFQGFMPQSVIIDKEGVTKLYLQGYTEQTPLFIEKVIEELLAKKISN
ncbi:TlpA family protein disulfide reductase [Flavobacterium aquicola]|uniref:Thiol-disulfide isomerase/thioredoxin n=1 Tax=Flavobacterium aquicola TaxID=1682742 RepID=A0A3E0EKT7_9FLAO|nr:TlpA disulfide reductase family protein [Flavobacterium aquicola]REG98872.1 thiol-disulfide isomerase/thioredoxin [Flavobacterium aquicola]